MVQQLRICLPMQGMSIRGFDSWIGKIPHALEQLSPQTTTAEPMRPRACAPQRCYRNEKQGKVAPLATTRKILGSLQ